MTLLRTVARPMLASVFFAGAANALKNTTTIAPKAKPVADAISGATGQPVAPATLVRINAGTQLLAAAGLATGRAPRLSALVLAGSLAPTTVVGHQFWNQSDPVAAKNQRLHFVKNVSVIGGLLMATLDPDPHKKFIGTRAKNKVVDAKDKVVDEISDLRR
ncbi:hypothetical protein ASD11_09410 [Aeromicrobium sp. Root495]|uniref:DoxX family protein n=1 Tax=Aeromicrobium sp. Root495 TaxID=1736550 RepID=UPI0006FC8EED|nr:DoxX family protein [Aeromicrobium sp. Root495]KQY59745.1 hypothetical protein ASD11_09410 [Aeromicrobium sp. Root495]